MDVEQAARQQRAELEALAVAGRLDRDSEQELEESRRFEAAARELIRRARERRTYAGATLLHAAGGSVELSFAGERIEPIDDLVADFPWPDRVRVKRVHRTYRELEQIHREVAGLRRELLGRSDGQWVSWIAEDTNDVRIMLPASDRARIEPALAAFGGAVRVLGERR